MVLGALALLNMMLTFMFQWYLVLKLGLGPTTDAYFASIVVPQLFIAIIGGPLMNVLVPLLSVNIDSEMYANAWSLVCLIGAILFVMTFFINIFAQFWVPLLVPGFSNQQKILTVNLTQIQMLSVFVIGANAVQLALLSAKNKFVTIELTQVISGLLALLSIYLFIPYYGVYAVAMVLFIRPLFLFILFMPQMGCPKINFSKDKTVLMVWARFKPLIVGSLYYKSDLLVDRYLLSNGLGGSLALYNLAQQIYGAAAQLIAKAITTPIVPTFSRLYSAKNFEDLGNKFSKTFSLLVLISAVAAFINIFFGHEILDFLMSYGSISKEDVLNLWWVTLWLIGQFVGGTIGQLAASAFYAVGDTKMPAKISIITFTIYLPLKVLAFNFYGIKGLALSTSALFILDCIILTLVFNAKFIQKFKFNTEKS